MRSIKVNIVLLLTIITCITCFLQDRAGKLDKIRGVNLGGWLVLEPWIKPSLFEQFLEQPREKVAIDESTFHIRLGYEEAKRQLEEHWSTWVTEEDFKVLSEWGVNLVRIPFGWWILGEDRQFVSGLKHLDRGIQLAKKYNMQVLLDLHAVPGSQNGFDNSGLTCSNIQLTKQCATDCPTDPFWHTKEDTIEYTKHVLLTIANRYKDYDNIYGIELLNEPLFTIDINFIKKFYYDCYFMLRERIPQDWVIVMHDSFRSREWQGFMQDKSLYTNVVLDTHIYFAFDVNTFRDPLDKVQTAPCNYQDQIDFMKSKQLPVIVGEWSLAKDDCARYLNGFKQGTRRESILGEQCQENKDGEFLTNFLRNQLYIWEQTNGWIFWNFKAERADVKDWNFIELIKNGWLPKSAADIPEFISTSQCKK